MVSHEKKVEDAMAKLSKLTGQDYDTCHDMWTDCGYDFYKTLDALIELEVLGPEPEPEIKNFKNTKTKKIVKTGPQYKKVFKNLEESLYIMDNKLESGIDLGKKK